MKMSGHQVQLIFFGCGPCDCFYFSFFFFKENLVKNQNKPETSKSTQTMQIRLIFYFIFCLMVNFELGRKKSYKRESSQKKYNNGGQRKPAGSTKPSSQNTQTEIQLNWDKPNPKHNQHSDINKIQLTSTTPKSSIRNGCFVPL